MPIFTPNKQTDSPFRLSVESRCRRSNKDTKQEYTSHSVSFKSDLKKKKNYFNTHWSKLLSWADGQIFCIMFDDYHMKKGQWGMLIVFYYYVNWLIDNLVTSLCWVRVRNKATRLQGHAGWSNVHNSWNRFRLTLHYITRLQSKTALNHAETTMTK